MGKLAQSRVGRSRGSNSIRRASSSRAEVMAALSGAMLAQAQIGAPRLGYPGCRAPGGMFQFEVPAWPPAKANQYRIVHPRTRAVLSSLGTPLAPPPPTLAVSPDVASFEVTMAQAIRAALDAIDYHVAWVHLPRRQSPIPLNPLFGHDVEVEATVAVCEPYRSNRDSDGVLKALHDVCTKMGLFFDDVQIGDTLLLRRDFTGVRPHDTTIVKLYAVPGPPSWAMNPGKRPLSTAAIARLVAREATSTVAIPARVRPRPRPAAAAAGAGRAVSGSRGGRR